MSRLLPRNEVIRLRIIDIRNQIGSDQGWAYTDHSNIELLRRRVNRLEISVFTLCDIVEQLIGEPQ